MPPHVAFEFALLAPSFSIFGTREVDARSTPGCHGLTATLVMITPGEFHGTTGDGLVVGTTGNDVVYGECGSDTMRFRNGDDNVHMFFGVAGWTETGANSVDVIGDGTANGGSGHDGLCGNMGRHSLAEAETMRLTLASIQPAMAALETSTSMEYRARDCTVSRVKTRWSTNSSPMSWTAVQMLTNSIHPSIRGFAGAKFKS